MRRSVLSALSILPLLLAAGCGSLGNCRDTGCPAGQTCQEELRMIPMSIPPIVHYEWVCVKPAAQKVTVPDGGPVSTVLDPVAGEGRPPGETPREAKPPKRPDPGTDSGMDKAPPAPKKPKPSGWSFEGTAYAAR